MPKLKLDRPIAFFDIEATGTSPRADRIIEIAILKLMPDHTRATHALRINPSIPIPSEATRIHGITDKDVGACPHFCDVAGKLFDIFKDADLGGYNVVRFDIPMLTEEFLRAGIRFTVDDRRVVDVQRVFHRREPRDLAAALAFYCGEMHFAAHGAEADVLATVRVLEGQFERYADLPRDIADLDKYCNVRDPAWADRAGKLRWRAGQIVINFGRRKGESLKSIVDRDPDFVKWMLRGDFPVDFREIVANAMAGKWPEPPALSEEQPEQ